MHFSKSEWEAYNHGSVDESKGRAMEQHLYHCDRCLEVFLSLVSNEDVQQAEAQLSPKFTQKLTARLPRQSKETTTAKTKPNLFYYYVAAACITAVFMGAGVFEGLVNNIPTIPEIQVELEIEEYIQFGWTDTLMNKTLSVFDTIKPKD